MRVLSQLTRQVAVVQYPTLSRSTVRHVELVALAPDRLLVVLILSTGRVEQRVLELEQPTSPTTTWLDLRTQRQPGRHRRADLRRRSRALRAARPTATGTGRTRSSTR